MVDAIKNTCEHNVGLKDGLGTLSLGFSQLHGHNSWLVCEVALRHLQNHVVRVPDHTHYMSLEVCWDDGLWTLSCELSQLHGQNTSLMNV